MPAARAIGRVGGSWRHNCRVSNARGESMTACGSPSMSRHSSAPPRGWVRSRRGAWVHTPSTFVAGEVVEELGADQERVVTVAEGIPAIADADPAAGRRLAGAARYVLALGTVEPRKDLPTLVRAFEHLAADDD